MGVIYKLKEEVVQFIISQRQSSPLASCRQLAESTSQKFGLNLSKSSVHDVLKESGIIMPRGRKPRPKFEIPQEKKKQIQVSLSQVNIDSRFRGNDNGIKLLPDPVAIEQKLLPSLIASPKGEAIPERTTNLNDTAETPPEYEGAGRIFLKAALWDLGIFSEENIKATDWNYYLTYSKGIKVVLENNKSFFIDLPLPLERCIREAADGLINNVKTFIVHKVSDEEVFKACMNAQAGFKIASISIVDSKDHILLEFGNIMESNSKFMSQNRVFMENNERNIRERSKAIFFSQPIDNNEVVDKILNLKGFDTTNKDENIVTLLIDDSYENKAMLLEGAEKLNGMYICDQQGRLVKVRCHSRPH